MSSSFFSSVMEFLSTPSARRATLTSSSQKTVQMIFLSTPSARRATLTLILTVDGHIISIHALREEGDALDSGAVPMTKDFYPRPPRGGRHPSNSTRYRQKGFLSTPSARRATVLANICAGCSRNFYPRPPRGGRPLGSIRARMLLTISIHALREEGDRLVCICACLLPYFYPRPPRGGRLTNGRGTGGVQRFLSTPSARRATEG